MELSNKQSFWLRQILLITLAVLTIGVSYFVINRSVFALYRGGMETSAVVTKFDTDQVIETYEFKSADGKLHKGTNLGPIFVSASDRHAKAVPLTTAVGYLKDRPEVNELSSTSILTIRDAIVAALQMSILPILLLVLAFIKLYSEWKYYYRTF